MCQPFAISVLGPALFIEQTAISGVLLLQPTRLQDARGFFSETYRASLLRDIGADHEWLQENHSRSVRAGTVRGLHFQAPPMAQAKLVRVVAGAILDLVVDIRMGSPTFGRHLAFELSEDNWTQIYIPPGVAHGFCTLTANSDIQYKVSQYYSPDHERGLRWDDPALGIRWPIKSSEACVSDRDNAWPMFADFVTPF